MESTVINIIGISVGFLQGVIIFLLTGMKTDISDVWKRMNNHYHEIECNNPECRTLKTGNVVIPRGSE